MEVRRRGPGRGARGARGGAARGGAARAKRVTYAIFRARTSSAPLCRLDVKVKVRTKERIVQHDATVVAHTRAVGLAHDHKARDAFRARVGRRRTRCNACF